jgi:hypothetical protein
MRSDYNKLVQQIVLGTQKMWFSCSVTIVDATGNVPQNGCGKNRGKVCGV